MPSETPKNIPEVQNECHQFVSICFKSIATAEKISLEKGKKARTPVSILKMMKDEN